MKHAVTKIALFVILSALFFPLNQTIAPEWDVQVLGADRKPLANITVREVWRQSSLEHFSQEQEQKTDANGQVRFERRLQRSNLLQRAFGCARQVMGAGVHASCGPRAYLVAFGDSIGTTDWQDPGQQQAGADAYQRSILIARPAQR